MRTTRCLSGMVLCALASSPISSQTTASADANAQAFGARESLISISLSPDGTKVAMILADGARGAVLAVADLTKGDEPRRLTRTTGDPEQLTRCNWATNVRLICSVRFQRYVGITAAAFGRLIAINADGTGLQMISDRGNTRDLYTAQNGGTLIDWGGGGADGIALITRQIVERDGAGTLITGKPAGLGVERVDTATLKRQMIEPPRGGATEYISDGHGNVRVMGMMPARGMDYDVSRIDYSYRKAGSRDWKELGQLRRTGSGNIGFDPYAVDAERNLVYGFENVDGRRALYSVALDGTKTKTLVYARADVDVDGLITFGRHRRVAGVSYATDRRVSEVFDPAIKAVLASLARALPGRAISFIDASTDETRMLLFAGSDVDPGRYYLYDRTTKRLGEIVASRPALAKAALATVQPITYPAADGTTIPGYLTLPPGKSSAKGLPAIVMPHGGPGSRDEWGFDWLSQYYAAQGYAVLQPNFRGSTGYGDAWFQKNGFQSWRTAVGDVNDGGRWLIAQGVADPAKLAVVGWSYGGYAALQSPMLDPALFKAIVAIAPVTDLEALREEARPYSNFSLVDAFIGYGAHLRDGSPADNAARITAPVMLVHGTRDTNVGVAQSRLMASRLKGAGRPAEYIEFEGLDHQLDDGAARTRMLRESDAFLRKSLAMPTN